MNIKDALIDIADYARQIGLPRTATHLIRLSNVDDTFDAEDRHDLFSALTIIRCESNDVIPTDWFEAFQFLLRFI